MFSLDISALEIIARTVIVYAALLVALRLAGKRELGQMTPFDLVVLLLVSEAVQNSIIGGDESLTGGLDRRRCPHRRQLRLRRRQREDRLPARGG